MRSCHSDPKPENETIDKLRTKPGCDPLDEGRRRRHAEEGAQRRGDRTSVAPGRSGPEGERDLPGNGCIAAGLLQLEAALRWIGFERVTRATAIAGRESEAEDSGGGPDAGQAHTAGSAVKKGLKPAARRQLVGDIRQRYELSEKRACGLAGITRWINRYQSRRDPQTGLRMRLRELAGSRTRYGYRRLTVLLRREGWKVNAKRVYRLYRAEQLQVRTKKRAKRAAQVRVPLSGATRPNQRWSMDFVSDRLADGRWFRILTVVDQYTRECLSAYADRSQTGEKVVEQMKRLVATRGAPESITTDNGGVLPAGPWRHGPIG